MSEPPKRIIIEKSRAVRRKYLRRNNTFRYSASQIARIDREEERERRAEQLREKEKKRITNKKKKAEKEAQEREERKRQGLPDPNALRVPSSQPLLSKFLAKPKPTPPPVQVPENDGRDNNRDDDGGDTEPDTPGSVETAEDSCDSFEPDDAEAGVSEDHTVALDARTGDLDAHGGDDAHNNQVDQGQTDDDHDKDGDEFSECSIFYDEDFIREAETVTTAPENNDQKTFQVPQQVPRPAVKSALEESFRDDTADLLEEFACGFDESFEKGLLQLNAR